MATKKTKRRANDVRQVGRWSDSQWDLVKKAAKRAGLTTAAWSRLTLLREARKELKQ